MSVEKNFRNLNIKKEADTLTISLRNKRNHTASKLKKEIQDFGRYWLLIIVLFIIVWIVNNSPFLYTVYTVLVLITLFPIIVLVLNYTLFKEWWSSLIKVKLDNQMQPKEIVMLKRGNKVEIDPINDTVPSYFKIDYKNASIYSELFASTDINGTWVFTLVIGKVRINYPIAIQDSAYRTSEDYNKSVEKKVNKIIELLDFLNGYPVILGENAQKEILEYKIIYFN